MVKEKLDYFKNWRKNNQEKCRESSKKHMKKIYATPIGRATYLLNSYKRNDKKYNRGEGDLTAEWIVEHIFSQPCAHCGKVSWDVIGCNRLDNSLPHTMDNVEPCCNHCNNILASEEKKLYFSKKVYQYTLDGELVKEWSSTAECGRNGYNQGSVAACCRGALKTYKGYIWSYVPL